MILFYSDNYVACGHAFDTTRKSAQIAESLRLKPIPNVTLQAPEPLTQMQLELAHSREYMDAVRTGQPRWLAESNGFSWDERMFDMVCASNGGVVAAVAQALKTGVSGSLSSGLHHAHRDQGGGFCTFNGLAIAAMDAIMQQKAQRVLVIDFDAHYGDGTASLIQGRDDIVMIDVSTGWRDGDYISECQKVLEPLNNQHFDLAIYNAGMDVHQDCRLGGRPGVTDAVVAEREALVFRFCRQNQWPIAFVLAGGYAGGKLRQEHLVDLHRLTIAEAARWAA